MRGIIFLAFNDYVEHHFGYAVLDELLLGEEYPNKGGFSTAESYCPSYLKTLISNLAKHQKRPDSEIWFEFGHHAFGHHAFGYLHRRFCDIYTNPSHPIFANSTFEFVENLNILHFDEMKKIYPQANFPRFEIRKKPNRLTLVYSSPLRLHDLVAGLLYGCRAHFSESIEISPCVRIVVA